VVVDATKDANDAKMEAEPKKRVKWWKKEYGNIFGTNSIFKAFSSVVD
jgi:hypothetical protein